MTVRSNRKEAEAMKHISALATIALAVVALALTSGCQNKKEPQARGPAADIPVRVTEKGFEPSRIEVKKGSNATLVFTRVTDKTCATDVIFSGNGAHLDLPLNQPVRIALGTVNENISFACGMKMLTGEVVAVR
jgi:plastocyanin domain-containing protein